jgi:hypothetical protein
MRRRTRGTCCSKISRIPPNIWWNDLERIMLAVDDLGCRELLA